MAYVPSFQNDVFLSYAHGDNEGGWVDVFHERLKMRLRELLGVPPTIWRDERRLGGDADFPAEIHRQVASAAVLLAIVSPSYLGSKFCRLERQAFSQSADLQGGIKVGTKFRIIKVVKTPKEGDQHRLFLKDALGFEFFRSTGEHDFDEFVPGDREFDSEVDRLALRLRDLLRDMRNERQAIYVAEPPAELESTWELVRKELAAKGYSVVPLDRLDEFFAEEALLAELRPAVLTVHLLGGTYHEFSVRQARLARELHKPAIVWVAPDISLDSRQREFVNDHAGFSASRARYVFLSNRRDWQLSQDILDELRPQKREFPVALEGKGQVSIYLICDRTDQAETSLACSLRESIVEREKMQVFLPAVDKDPGILDLEHSNRLSACDGVLLYWGRAGKEWFLENYVDINRAPRRLRGARPFRSEAIVLGKSGDSSKRDVGGRLVIRDFDEPRLDRLEPFLAPLRSGIGLPEGV
jgi:hypothetical protein